MSSFRCLFFVLSLYFIVFPILASGTESNTSTIAGSRAWQKLLHLSDKGKSYIISEDFWISATKDPFQELQATINAFNSGNKLCQFPSRALFLNRYGYTFDLSHCDEYLSWKIQKRVDSVSVMFASGYMGNPASMYGHMLLRFDSKKKARLLNTSVNYGAKIPPNENAVVYIIKGIFGGYIATYSDQQYYRHEHNYANQEQRDLWSYQLNLNASDTALFVAHIFEILKFRFDYYFIDENCAFHIAKVIEIFTDNNLISDNALWTIPAALATAMEKQRYQGMPLVEKTEFIASGNTSLLRLFETIEKRGLTNIAENMINNGVDMTHPDYQSLTIDDKKLLVESLMTYHQVTGSRNQLNQNQQLLINERLLLPVGKVSVANTPTVAKPDTANKPALLSVGLIDLGGSLQGSLGFRMNYFDELTFNPSQKPFGALEVLDTELAIEESSIILKQLTLARVQSLPTTTSSIDYFQSDAWRIDVGYRDRSTHCTDCDTGYIRGDYGRSTGIDTPYVKGAGYGFIGFQNEFGEFSNTYLTGTLGAIFSIHERVKFKAEVGYLHSLKSRYRDAHVIELETNIKASTNSDIRFFYRQDSEKVIGIRYQHYWDF